MTPAAPKPDTDGTLPRQVIDFIFFLLRRLYRDRCTKTAASLTYTSLLATIPFLVVTFSIIRQFPVFPELVNSLQATVLQVFTPHASEGVIKYIQQLVNKTHQLPILSFLALIVTSAMTLYTIDDTFNRIWRIENRRRTWFSLMIYFLVIISVPVLIGVSLALTTYVFYSSGNTGNTTAVNWLASVPWLVTLLAFTSLYKWMPNTHVRWKYALSGGVVAMLLFELAKWGFALYISLVPTYGVLYGTLAAIPLTLIWIYLSWLVVLVGAEMARCLMMFQQDTGAGITAEQLLGYFLLNREQGLLLEQVAAREYLSKGRMRHILRRLQQTGLVHQAAKGRYTLTVQADAMNLTELTSAFDAQLKLI